MTTVEKQESWLEGVTEAELRRLRTFQVTGRINSVLLEVVDFFTDLLFVVTLYTFSQAGEPSEGLLKVLTATVALPGAGPRDLEFFNVLFAVSLVILLTNFIARAAISVRAFLKYRSFINTGKEWAQFAFSVVLSQIEPHNSLLYLNSVFADEKPLTDVEYLFSEIRMDALLLLAEDLPQAIIQVIFFTAVRSGELTITWYLAAFTTFLSLASAGGGIIIMYYQARSLQRKQRNRIAANAVSA